MHARTLRRQLAVAGSVALLSALLSASPATASGVTVVASGLNSPRQLTFSPGGALYVAEAGTGGPRDGNCRPHPALPGGGCLGFTGSIARLSHGHVDRVVRGLPSVAGASSGVDQTSTRWPRARSSG